MIIMMEDDDDDGDDDHDDDLARFPDPLAFGKVGWGTWLDDDHDGDEVAWVCRERQALAAGTREHTDLAHGNAIFLGSLDDNLAGN